jgi:UDP-N-acetylmuramoyl-L-alanyl-D-glutamate--2,6-diaminopimelate ligase
MSTRPAQVVQKSLSTFDKSIFDKDIKISGIAINAAQVKKGDIFVALAGTKTHGANFVDQAIQNGAVAVLSDKKLDLSIPSFIHPSPREILGELSAWVYEKPFTKLTAIGITGTNGKTTTSNILKQIWQLSGLNSGLIGTLGVEVGSQSLNGVRTTPEADELQALAALMVSKDLSHLVMEVSSHGLDQLRVKGAKFKVVGFSNLTQDHLDYHKNMDNYFNAKAKLFSKEYAESAVINIDDQYGLKLSKQVSIPIQTVSRNNKNANWYYEKIEPSNDGFEIEINSKDGKKISGKFPLIGEFNLDNLLLAVALASMAGLDEVNISSAITKLTSVPGRLEQIKVGQEFTALVDYAHTPDAVARVLEIAAKFTKGKVIAVLGCGGDRDISKRPLMGQALFIGSDKAIFTSDNPRSESADEILKAMVAGIDLADKGFVIKDRRAAIDFAVAQASVGDCLLILGKGHESGQEVNGIITPFDDRIELADSIKQVLKK